MVREGGLMSAQCDAVVIRESRHRDLDCRSQMKWGISSLGWCKGRGVVSWVSRYVFDAMIVPAVAVSFLMTDLSAQDGHRPFFIPVTTNHKDLFEGLRLSHHLLRNPMAHTSILRRETLRYIATVSLSSEIKKCCTEVMQALRVFFAYSKTSWCWQDVKSVWSEVIRTW